MGEMLMGYSLDRMMLEVERGMVSQEAAMKAMMIKFVTNCSLPREIERINLDERGIRGDLRDGY